MGTAVSTSRFVSSWTTAVHTWTLPWLNTRFTWCTQVRVSVPAPDPPLKASCGGRRLGRPAAPPPHLPAAPWRLTGRTVELDPMVEGY